MTGGTVAVLGITGRNFAAGMSGGIAYVLDEDGEFARRCNAAMVDLEPVLTEPEQQAKVARSLWHLGESDESALKRLIESHARYTGSKRAQVILDKWSEYRPRFVKIFPKEYRRALGELAANGKKAAALRRFQAAAQAPTPRGCQSDHQTPTSWARRLPRVLKRTRPEANSAN